MKMEQYLPLLVITILVIAVISITLLLIRYIKQILRMTLKKFEPLENESNRTEFVTNALASIPNAIDNLKEKIKKLPLKKRFLIKKSNRVEIEILKQGIIQKLELLNMEISSIGKKISPDTAAIIEKFETKYLDLKHFLFDLSPNSKIGMIKDIKRVDVEHELAIIQRAINLIRLECWKLNVTKQLAKILSDHGQYLENERKLLKELIETDLKEGFSSLKNRENEDFGKMKEKIQNSIHDFKELEGHLAKQLETLSSTNQELESLEGQVMTTTSELDNLKTRFSKEHGNLSELKNNFSHCNDDLNKNLDKIQYFQLNFEKLQINFNKLESEIASILKAQNTNLTQNNVDLKTIVSEMSITKSQFEVIGTGILRDTSSVSKSLSEIIDHFNEIIDEIRNTETLYNDLITKALNELNSQMHGLEYKIRQIEEIPTKIVQYFASEEFIKEIDELIDRRNKQKEEIDLYISLLKDYGYLRKMPKESVRRVSLRIMNEPRFSKDYRFIAIDCFQELLKFRNLNKDQWFWKLWDQFLEQFDILLPPFLFNEEKCIYDIYLENKPEGFNLKDLTEMDLKDIINQHHWVQIWEPFLRWTYFFNAYLDKDQKYLIDRHQHYAQKIEKLFQESLGYQIELFPPLEMISKSLIETRQVTEISDQVIFFKDILPNIKHLEKLRNAVQKLEFNTDNKLIVFVDQIGLLDKGKRIRESKLLFYSPLLMKYEK